MTMAERGFDFDMANGQKGCGKWQVESGGKWMKAACLALTELRFLAANARKTRCKCSTALVESRQPKI